MIVKHNIDRFSWVFLFIRTTLASVLITLVLTKSLTTFVINNCEDKMELSSVDSEQEEDSEEQQDQEEDKIEEIYISSIHFSSLESSLLKHDVDSHQKHTSDFRLGIILPPPEIV